MVGSLIMEKKVPVSIGFLVLLLFATFVFINTSEQRFELFPSSFSSQASPPAVNDSTLLHPVRERGNVRDDSGTIITETKKEVRAEPRIVWKSCKGLLAVDYIPCLDNQKAISQLKSRRHKEHRERHCPMTGSRCLAPLPVGYKIPIPWPKSRDMIWYDNVPHPKLVEYKKSQRWVVRKDDVLVFPGGGTQFKEGVKRYISFIERSFPAIKWGLHTRVVLDVGCGVASFGGSLLEKNVIAMSFAPNDEHEAQIQFALERGIPATLAVIGTQKLPYPDDAFDLIHCARCRVHWDADGGKPLLELNRLLRPGGFFVWSATPVYLNDDRDLNVWKSMEMITKSICWKAVIRTADSSGIGLVIYRKATAYSCYEQRQEKGPPICINKTREVPWYAPLSGCISRLPVDKDNKLTKWPVDWPRRLNAVPPSISGNKEAEQMFNQDTKQWASLVSEVYLKDLAINWSSVRNIMDMNSGYGGFAAALIKLPFWVMNVVPVTAPNTLPIIYDRGLIGMYHDWCESFSTYPRTYDLLHASYLLENVTQRCDILAVAAEIDRVTRPGGYIVIQDTIGTIQQIAPILKSLHWSTHGYLNQFLVGRKGFWRPG